MATQQQFNGTGIQTDFVITLFEFLQPSDVNIKVGTDVQESPSDYSIDGTTIKFTSAPASGTNNITAERDTNIATKAHTYEPGSSITAQSLNDNQNQALFKLEENAKNAVTTTTLAGNKSTITVSSDNVTWSINNDVIDNQHLKDNAVDTAEIKQNAVTSNEIATNAVTHLELKDDASTDGNRAVTTNHIRDNAITMAKLGSGALPTDITVASANLVDSTIATADIANSQITLTKLATAVANALTPVGTVIWYAGTAAPTNYLICNGNAVPNGSGTVQSITADFSALYAVIGGFLPHIQDGHYIRGTSGGGSTGYFTTRQAMDWKSFNLKSINDDDGTASTYTHETNMGKSTTTYLPTDGFFGGKYQTPANEISLKWDADGTSEIRPKSIILLPCIKY
jgi:hypothetical protein